ncbi:gamma-glutamylcyclotransferase [Mesorhizobium soli]|uniref:gamma-glutamylcyclotransferase family protein n=1 Tax=Pseudaminobacter soli (ex Li et al. 2025) TaxID=1295366 RepID=UPI0024730008|nr:gamma-glutamylcyclotransferase [Mesorhizobium soli]MDH6232230.1 gamma-glutamylcyclotransferase [Mesorhizobium soli]
MTQSPINTYFAYGTLLGERHMRESYPSAKATGVAFYDQHELGFWRYADAASGGCTIVHNPDGILFGVLYELSREDMARLLEVGGLAAWYEARELDVTRVTGGRTRVVTLRVEGNRGPWVPPVDYAALVTNGAREAALPQEYIAKLDSIVEKARRGA